MFKKWYFWAGLLFILLSAGGVFYGVMTHKEPGFMGVCWKNGAVEKYHDPLKSPNPECKTELKWKKDQLPLTYFIAFSKDHKDYIDSVVKGAEMWNREIGREVFKRVDKEDGATVQVTWGGIEPDKDHPGGSTTHTGGPDGPTGAKVVLNNPSDVHAVLRYAAHEWGHVLGLAHDEAPRSIMYPVQPDTTDKMTFVLPSDFDKKILRAAYK